VLARYLDVNAPLREEATLADTDHVVALVIGKDFTEIRKEPRPEGDFKDAIASATGTSTTNSTTNGVTTSTTAGPNGKDIGTATTTPTEPPANAPSKRAFVPDPPPGVEC
jgi:hypothetical protein